MIYDADGDMMSCQHHVQHTHPPSSTGSALGGQPVGPDPSNDFFLHCLYLVRWANFVWTEHSHLHFLPASIRLSEQRRGLCGTWRISSIGTESTDAGSRGHQAKKDIFRGVQKFEPGVYCGQKRTYLARARSNCFSCSRESSERH